MTCMSPKETKMSALIAIRAINALLSSPTVIFFKRRSIYLSDSPIPNVEFCVVKLPNYQHLCIEKIRSIGINLSRFFPDDTEDESHDQAAKMGKVSYIAPVSGELSKEIYSCVNNCQVFCFDRKRKR